MNLQLLYRTKKNQNKYSWNNLFIDQTYLLGTTLLQQGVPNEWLNRSNNMGRPFRAQMKMDKVEAILRIKNRRAELVQTYEEDKEFNDRANNDDTEEDDSGYESGNWGEPWKNYEDVHYITDKELEIILQKIFKENTVWDFVI